MTSYPTRALKAMVAGKDSYGVPFSGLTGYSYVEDVARMFVLCGQRLRGKQTPVSLVFNIRGHVADVTDFVRCVENAVPAAKGKIKVQGKPLIFDPDVDESGLRGFLGKDFPDRSLQDAVNATVAVLRANQARGVWHTVDIDEDPFAPPKPLLPVSRL